MGVERSTGQLGEGVELQGERGRYQIGSLLGRGGFGETYLARRMGDDHPVVVKSLRLERIGDWKAVELFEREARALERLDHPSLPAYHDHFALGDPEQPEGFLLVQEFIDGPTLATITPRPTPAQLDEWLREILHVLTYLHGQHPPIIHRDINPRNLLARRSDGRVFLIDFGAIQDAIRSENTIVSTSAGTFGYAPMEQFVGRATPASDLYSLAVTYLALASGLEPEAMAFRDNRIQVAEVLGGFDVDARVKLQLEAMTEPDAARRPQSAEAVLRQLDGTGSMASSRSSASAGGIARTKASAQELAPLEELERQWRARAARAEAIGKRSAKLMEVRLDDLKASLQRNGRIALLSAREMGSWKLDLAEMTVDQLTRSDGFGIDQTQLTSDGRAVLDGRSDVLKLVEGDGSVRAVSLPEDFFPFAMTTGVEACVNPGGEILALVSRMGVGKNIQLLDLESGQPLPGLARPMRHGSFALDGTMRFTPDGQTLVINGGYQGLGIVGADRSSTIHEGIDCVNWSDDGRQLVMVQKHGGARWLMLGRFGDDPVSFDGEPSRLWSCPADASEVVLGPGGAMIAVAHDHVSVIDARSEELIFEPEHPLFAGQKLEASKMGFSADGRRLFVVASDRLSLDADRTDEALWVFSIERRECLGWIASGVEEDGLFMVSPMGLVGRLDRDDSKSDLLRGLLCGRAPEEVLGDRAEAWIDLGLRQRLLGQAVVEERLMRSKLVACLKASGGLTHLLPHALEGAADQARQNPRFGQSREDGQAQVSADQLIDVLRKLSQRSTEERQLLFEDSLQGLLHREQQRLEARRTHALAVQREQEMVRRKELLGRAVPAVAVVVIVVIALLNFFF